MVIGFVVCVRRSEVYLKKRKEKIDINVLKQIFTLENNLVEIKGIAMMDSQIQNIDLIIENFIALLIKLMRMLSMYAGVPLIK